MEPRYVLILDFCVGCLNIIRLTDEELRESENYENFENFLPIIYFNVLILILSVYILFQ